MKKRKIKICLLITSSVNSKTLNVDDVVLVV